MKIYGYLMVLLILASCKNGCNSAGKGPGSDSTQTDSGRTNANQATAQKNPRLLDSIVPASLKDTVKFDNDYNKDSLRMSIRFQLAANALCRILKEKDAAAYARFTPPNIKKAYGGEKGFVSFLQKSFDQDPSVVTHVIAGPVKRTAAAMDDQQYAHGWYCLIPLRRYVKDGAGEAEEMQWFGGQTLDEGKNIFFINVTKVPREQILKIMPDLRFVLDPEASNAPATDLP